MNLLIISLLTLGGVTLARRASRAADQLEYGLYGLPGFAFKSGLQVTIPMRITNPNNTPLAFEAINCDVQHNESAIGRIVHTKRTEIPATGYVDVPLVLRVQGLATIAAIMAVIKSRQPGALKLKGFVKAGPVNFPLDVTYNLQKEAKK